MNSLSWLLYFINLAGNFSAFLTGALVISIGFLLGWVVVGHTARGDYNSYRSENGKKSHLDLFNLYKKYVWIPVLLGVMLALIPNQRTMYLIAASEIGEKVITNDKVIGLVDPSIDILKNYVMLENEKIRKELKNFTEEKNKK